MAENDDPTPGPAEPTSVPETAEQPAVTETAPAAAAGPAPQPASGPRFTERVWNFRAMVAVALAALLLGGGIGSAITAVSHDDRHDRGPGMMRWQDGPGGGPFMGPGGPGGIPDQQFRDDLKDMRKKFRERMKQRLQERPDAPPPSTPSPTAPPSSNG